MHIQNAYLYQSEQSRPYLAETHYEVGHDLSPTLDLTEVLNLILEHLAKTVPYDRAAVMLQNKGELEFVAAKGFPDDVQPLQLRIAIKDDDVFQQIYHTRQPLVIPDLQQRPDWQYVEYLPQARAWLGVPLTRFDQVIGMLSRVREAPDASRQPHSVLAPISRCYPHLHGKLPTRYAPLRRSHPLTSLQPGERSTCMSYPPRQRSF